MTIWVLVLVALNILDVITTRIGLSLGAHEINPVMRTVINSWTVWPIKIGAPLIFGALVIKSGAHNHLLYMMVGIYTALVIWNVLNLAIYYAG